MDVLRRLVEREVKAKRINTYKVDYTSFISHLIYVDDVLIFSEVNTKSLNAIKKVLEKFSSYSGLGINSARSIMSLSKVCAEDQSLQNILGFSIIPLLGLPITGKKKFYNHCWKLIQPIEAMLGKWSGKCLSYGEKIQLIN